MRITHGQVAAMESAILPEETQQLEDVRDIGVAIAVDVATIVCSEGTDRLQDVVHIASAITVEVAIAATDALDDAIQRVLGDELPDDLGRKGRVIMPTVLDAEVLDAMTGLTFSPSQSSDASAEIDRLRRGLGLVLLNPESMLFCR